MRFYKNILLLLHSLALCSTLAVAGRHMRQEDAEATYDIQQDDAEATSDIQQDDTESISEVGLVSDQESVGISEAPSPEPSTKKIECKDENGKGVSWFIAYKLPKLRSASGSTFRQGTGYSYILPGYKKWRPSERPISNLNSIVGQTIQPLIQSSAASEFLSIIYNDQPPERDAFSGNGHSKGIVLGNGGGGLWLFHSVPKFPLTGENFYPSNGLVNGQMFLCLTLRTVRDIDSLGDTFTLTRPNIGNASIPENLGRLFPKLKKFVTTKRFRGGGPLNATSNLKVGQLTFTVFAKSPKFDKEIYMDWLAPTLESDLEVQSWRSGQGVLNSSCNTHSYQVVNIDQKRIDGNDFTKNDHSKWLVTPKGSENSWICVSDLNRMRGQASRGGATLCTSNNQLWNAFNSAVTDLEPCPRNISDKTNS